MLAQCMLSSCVYTSVRLSAASRYIVNVIIYVGNGEKIVVVSKHHQQKVIYGLSNEINHLLTK